MPLLGKLQEEALAQAVVCGGDKQDERAVVTRSPAGGGKKSA